MNEDITGSVPFCIVDLVVVDLDLRGQREAAAEEKVDEAAEDTIFPEKAPAEIVPVVPEGHLVDVGS